MSVRWLGKRKLAQTALCTLTCLVLAVAAVPQRVEGAGHIDSAEEFTTAFLEQNAGILDILHWPETVAYSERRTAFGVAKETIVIQFDSGIAYEQYPWMHDYMFKFFGQSWGYDVVGDNPRPLDDEDVDITQRHGTLGAMVMGAMGAQVMLVRVGWSSRGTDLSNVKSGMELAMQMIEDIESITGEEYNIVVNMSLGFWKNAAIESKLINGWFGPHGETRLFPKFIKEWSSQIESAGYNPDDITYEDVISRDNIDLLDIAIDWLFNAIFVKGSLTEDLGFGDGEGAWPELSEMVYRGWVVLASAGNGAVDGVYPALLEDAEAVQEIRFTEEGAVCPLLQDDWAQLVAPGNLSVYNPDEDVWFEVKGTSFSTNVASAVYAKVWEAAPDLTDIELNDIVLRTAEPFTYEFPEEETTFEKRFIMPYRAIRVASVYQDIQRAVTAYEAGDIGFAAMRGQVREALDDHEDEPTFADVGAYGEIFRGASPGEIRPPDEILDILIEKSMILVPADRLEEALASGLSASWTARWMEPVGIGTSSPEGMPMGIGSA